MRANDAPCVPGESVTQSLLIHLHNNIIMKYVGNRDFSDCFGVLLSPGDQKKIIIMTL